MGKFTQAFMDEMNQREAARVLARLHQFAQQKANAMRGEGSSPSEIVAYLAPMLGCPCSGPKWYRDLVIEAYRENGEALPPELAGVSH